MTDRLAGIYKFTPEAIENEAYDRRLVGGLVLIRQGIQELSEMNGSDDTHHYVERYTPRTGTFEEFWRGEVAKGWDPFLLVGIDKRDREVGAFEGRRYHFKRTDEPAVFTNWVVTGREMRRRGVGLQIYERVEAIAQASGVRLLIAGIHPANEPSIGLHRKFGFVKEESDKTEAFPTARGAFIPPYGVIEYYTKRLGSV